MEPVIYADVLIFLNAVVTFFLLLTVKQFTGAKTSAGRLISGAFVGGVYSLTVLAPQMHFILMLIAKTAMSLSITFIAFHSKRMKKMLQCFVLFWAVGFLYAGVMYAIRFLLQGSFITVNNGAVYFDLNVYSLIFLTVLVYGVILLLRKRVFRFRSEDMIYDIELNYGDTAVRAKALLDTGNHVRDIYTNHPVVILNAEVAERLTHRQIKSDTADLFAAANEGIRLRLLPVQALSGEKYLPAFTADSAQIITDDRRKEIRNVSVAVTDDKLGEEKYQALIGEEML